MIIDRKSGRISLDHSIFLVLMKNMNVSYMSVVFWVNGNWYLLKVMTIFSLHPHILKLPCAYCAM